MSFVVTTPAISNEDRATLESWTRANCPRLGMERIVLAVADGAPGWSSSQSTSEHSRRQY